MIAFDTILIVGRVDAERSTKKKRMNTVAMLLQGDKDACNVCDL